MYEALDADWAWTSRFSSLGFSLTFARARAEADMLQAYGVNPEDAEVMTLTEATEEFGVELPVIRVGRASDWAFAFEEFGRLGSDEDVLCKLAADTQAATVLCTGDGTSTFTFAESGVVSCALDLVMPAWRRGRDPDRFNDTLRSVGLNPNGSADAEVDPVVAGLRLLSVEFGIYLDGTAIDGPLLSGEASGDDSWLE